MIDPEQECEHTCPRDCTFLNEALRHEQAMALFYDWLLTQCDYPDAKAFVEDLAKEQHESIHRIETMINRLYSSFNPAGC